MVRQPKDVCSKVPRAGNLKLCFQNSNLCNSETKSVLFDHSIHFFMTISLPFFGELVLLERNVSMGVGFRSFPNKAIRHWSEVGQVNRDPIGHTR